MDTRQLNSFLTVAECLNFTEAARRLYITQPSLSRQIQELETELSVQLFYRDKRSVTVTPAGELLRGEAIRLMKNIDHLKTTMQKTVSGTIGCLSIGCTGLEKDFFANQVKKFRQHYPDISVSIDLPPSLTRQIRRLLENEYDVIFTLADEVEKYPELTEQVLYADPLCVVLPEDHPAAGQAAIELAELKNESFIFMLEQDNPESLQRITNACVAAGFAPHVTEQAPNIASLFILIESGMGISLISRHMQHFANDHVRFVPVTLAGETIPIRIVAAWRRDTKNASVPLFLKELVDLEDMISRL